MTSHQTEGPAEAPFTWDLGTPVGAEACVEIHPSWKGKVGGPTD